MHKILIMIALITVATVATSPLVSSEADSVSEAPYSPLSYRSDNSSASIRIYRNSDLCELLVHQNSHNLELYIALYVKNKCVQEIHFDRIDKRVPYQFDDAGTKETLRIMKVGNHWELQSDFCNLDRVNEDIISMQKIMSKEDTFMKDLNLELLEENIELKAQLQSLKAKIKTQSK